MVPITWHPTFTSTARDDDTHYKIWSLLVSNKSHSVQFAEWQYTTATCSQALNYA